MNCATMTSRGLRELKEEAISNLLSRYEVVALGAEALATRTTRNTPTARTASSTPDIAARPRTLLLPRQAFAPELSDADAAAHFSDLIHKSLATRTTQVNNAVHILAH